MAWKLGITALAFATSASALWPQPRNITTGSNTLRLADNFDIKVSVDNAPSDLNDAVSRAKAFLANDKLERLVVGRGASDSVQGAKTLPGLTLSLEGSATKSISDEALVALESRDEAYTLSVPSDGSGAVLKANSTLGLFRYGLSHCQILCWLNASSTEA